MSRDRDLRFPNRDGLRLLFPFDYRQGKYAFQNRDWGTVSIMFIYYIILEIDELVLVTYIWRLINIDIFVMCVLVYCIQVDYF